MPSGFPAFRNGPDDQRLAAAHIAGREHAGHAGVVGGFGGVHVAARIRPYSQLAEQARVGGAGEAQGQQYQLARQLRLAALMKLPSYQLRANNTLDTYWFVSEGHKDLLTKRIQFTLINQDGIYNLAFRHEHATTGELDDLAISDNGDSNKVLATVVGAAYAFFDRHPAAWVYLSGSTSARTRLYQMAIAKYLPELSEDFAIYG